jgi:P-loop containing dynein motor region
MGLRSLDTDNICAIAIIHIMCIRWEAWTAPAYVQPQPFKFHEVMVPTTDSVTHTYLLDNLAPRKPVLFVGDSGTAKTITVERYMAGLKQDAYARLVSVHNGYQNHYCYCLPYCLPAARQMLLNSCITVLP